jgi:hypothetical protein
MLGRLVRFFGVALMAVGLLTWQEATQFAASAAPPPVVTSGFATYPPPLVASCTVPGGGAVPGTNTGVLTGFRTWIDPTSASAAQIAAGPATDFADPGAAAGFAASTMIRFEKRLVAGNVIIAQWTGWAAGCTSLPISFPVKKTTTPNFALDQDQALVREPNGPFVYNSCRAPGQGTPQCIGLDAAHPTQFRLTAKIPPVQQVCNFQADVVIGGPLETVGPHGTYYQTTNRQLAAAAGLGTFNTSPPNMLIDRANGGFPCLATPRMIVNKLWAGTGTTPPSNLPAGFTMTVTSREPAPANTLLGTATCTYPNKVFTCAYRDATAPTVPQTGLLISSDAVITVTETAFPGNIVDITFPITKASRFIDCPSTGTGACQLTVTNTPPKPPPPTTTTTTDVPTTTPTTLPTSVTPPPTFPSTLPPTGAPSSSTPLLLIGAVLVPFGLLLVVTTRRRSRAT